MYTQCRLTKQWRAVRWLVSSGNARRRGCSFIKVEILESSLLGSDTTAATPSSRLWLCGQETDSAALLEGLSVFERRSELSHVRFAAAPSGDVEGIDGGDSTGRQMGDVER